MVGGGPAGHALAGALHARGASAAVVDRRPDATWPATYGAWADELPAGLPDQVMASRTDPVPAVGRSGQHHRLARPYVMLDTVALADHLRAGGHAVRPGRVVAARRDRDRVVVRTDDGRSHAGRLLVDATGARRLLTGGPGPSPRAAQTAVGVEVTVPVEAAFMDWRDDHGQAGPPTFLYAVPLGGGRTLLEETSLAARPGVSLADLRDRLAARLAARGIDWPDGSPVERVAFPVDLPVRTGRGAVVPFGAAAPLMHPATGYSLATSLSLADPVAEAIIDALPAGGAAAADAARRVIWSPQARAVHLLRRRGLEVLLSLPPAGVGDFFDVFFSLPVAQQRAYLSVRDDLPAVAAAMTAVFRAAGWPLRRHLMRLGIG